MPSLTTSGTGSPTLIFGHFFGSSRREWQQVIAKLQTRYRCIAFDSPGFGDATDVDGYTVEEMTQRLLDLVRSMAPEPCVLVGHSMTGKVSMVAASRRPVNLLGMVLVAPSPLEPEPMSEDDRMVLENAQRNADTARTFLLKGAKSAMSVNDIEDGVADVLRANPTAWRRWPQSGAREDWSSAIPTIDLATLLVIGANDPAIPLDFQKKHTLPHLKNGKLEVISSVGHLVPYEAPVKLAALIDFFVSNLP